MQKNIFSFLLVIILLLAGFFLISRYSSNLTPDQIKYVKVAGQSIRVELALDQAKQERGLSGRVQLKDNEGMLFVFETSGIYPFWMKDMNFPIDIIWINEEREVVYIKKDARPELFPEIYDPNENAIYVLEVVSGFSEKNKLKEGDKVELF